MFYFFKLLKQSQIILNYLAQETCITTQHLDCIWAAAQVCLIKIYNYVIINTCYIADESIHNKDLSVKSAMLVVGKTASNTGNMSKEQQFVSVCTIINTTVQCHSAYGKGLLS